MLRTFPIFGAALTAMVLAQPGLAETDDKVAIRTELQVSMQRHIDRNTFEGAFLHIDPETGGLRMLYPTDAHPMIVHGADFFVMCADLADKEGNTLEVDFYAVEGKRGYKIFRTAIDQRDDLKALMQAGLVSEY